MLAINASDGSLITSWGGKDVAIAPGPPATWGAHGLSVEQCSWPCAEGTPFPWFRVYIEDFTGHTVRSFDGTGNLIATFGMPGVAGNDTSPLQFGSVADATVAWSTPFSEPVVFASDGDGGTANRVVAFKASVPPTVLWATPAVYDNPHSIALHVASGLLIVADREQEQLRLIRAQDGVDLGAWNCGLHLGAEGRPFGVRTYSDAVARGRARDYLFVASMDNPQDGKFQRISVLDASGLTAAAGAASPCAVLQTLSIEPTEYSGPHLLGVDHATGDIYAALVADKPRSTVLRFKCVDC